MRIRALASICSFSVILSMVLAGCGGGGEGSDASSGASPEASDAATRQALQSTNLDVGPSGLKRWNPPIPVKTNNDPRAVQAMNAIEGRLGATIFDRTSIATTDDSLITRGLVISVGTAPSTSICGAVDTTAAEASSETTGKIVINLDSAGCTASLDATIHEFGHALGVFRHFQNFGVGNATGELFWRVLRTIYLNPIGTPGPNVVLAP